MSKAILHVLYQLLRRDLMIFRRSYWEKFIDMVIVFLVNVLIFSYFMSGQGIASSYGPFMLTSAIATFGLIEVVGKISLLLSDIEGERAITQLLLMPVRSGAIFIYTAFFWALSSILLSLLLFPVGKLALWTRF